MIIILLTGIRVARDIYSEMFPIEEKVYDEIEELLNSNSGIVCVLIPQKTFYRIGEKPQINVLIIHKTDSTIYLPYCLDGSSDMTRLPYCNIEILNMHTGKWEMGFVCGVVNPLVENDLQLLRPNECFNPLAYKLDIIKFELDSISFFESHTITQLAGNWLPSGLRAKNYLIPKNYKIQFVYDTKDTTTTYGWNTHENFTNFNLDRLDSIPRISIKSNIVTLKYRLF
jgi:hypothetical protein